MLLRHVITASLLLMLQGCSYFVQEPRITLKEAGIVGLDMSGIDVELSLNVTNPNSFDLSLLGYTYDFRVSSLPVAAGTVQEAVLFPAGAETGLRLPVRLRFADMLELLRRNPDPDRIPLQVRSTLVLDTPVGELSVPMEKRVVLTIPEPYRPTAYLNLLQEALGGGR